MATTDFSTTIGLVADESIRNGFQSSPVGVLEHVFFITEDSTGNIWFSDRDSGV